MRKETLIMNTSDRIIALLKDRKIPVSVMEKDLGFANGFLTKPRKGGFDADRLYLISQYLNVSIDYLITGIVSDDIMLLSTSEHELLDLYNGMNIEGQDDLLKYARLLAASGQYKKHCESGVV